MGARRVKNLFEKKRGAKIETRNAKNIRKSLKNREFLSVLPCLHLHELCRPPLVPSEFRTVRFLFLYFIFHVSL
jgi:hypothetical protein